MKTSVRLVKHARYYWLLLAESHLTRRLFGAMMRRIELQTSGWGVYSLGCRKPKQIPVSIGFVKFTASWISSSSPSCASFSRWTASKAASFKLFSEEIRAAFRLLR